MRKKEEEKKVSLIVIENFPKNLRLGDNKLFLTFQVKKDEDAFNKLKENIEENYLYNVILSGHKTVEDAYGLLKSFLEYNISEENYIDQANYPFFMFIENEKFDKKKLYSYYIKQEKNIENLKEENCIDSKILIFSPNELEGIKKKLNLPFNYYNRKDWKVKNNPYYSPNIRIMYVGVTGTGKSTLINQLNGKKLSYSSSDNQAKTKEKIKGKAILFKNQKYPILNQDTEGFEIANKSQLEKVNENINKNCGNLFNERVHIVIYLLKNENGLDNDDIALFVKLHKMNILYYALWPKNDKKDKKLQGNADRLIKSLIEKFKNNNNLDDLDDDTKNIFKEFLKEKDNLIQILKEIQEKRAKIIFSSNILAKKSEGKIKLLNQIKDDLLEIKIIHEKYIETIEKENSVQEKMRFGISGDMLKKEDNKNYYKMLDNSPFFSKYSIEEIKRKEAEELLNDCEISPLWLVFYNKRVENFRKELLEKIKVIYSDVKIGIELEEKIFDNKESWFYKTEFTKKFIIKLIDFFEEKYKELELNEKYYSACKNYNSSITEFVRYVEEFSNFKLNEEPILYDIDLI